MGLDFLDIACGFHLMLIVPLFLRRFCDGEGEKSTSKISSTGINQKATNKDRTEYSNTAVYD